MWDLPGLGIEPMSPALAGGFLTTVPPGKHSGLFFLFVFVGVFLLYTYFNFCTGKEKEIMGTFDSIKIKAFSHPKVMFSSAAFMTCFYVKIWIPLEFVKGRVGIQLDFFLNGSLTVDL